jgi:sn-glycerol 3-phosphate transport system substrate-binding protein
MNKGVSHKEAGMSSKISRRSLIKTAGAVGASAAALKASKAFHAPTVLAQSGPVKITYWAGFTGQLADAQTQIVKMFNDSQKDVVVDFQNMKDYETTAQKLTAALATDTVPDAVLLSDVWWYKFFLNQALVPMNDFMSAAKVDLTDFVPSFINEGKINGEYYWMPFARSTPLFYYNNDMFKAAGLTDAPKTWDELASWAPQLLKKDSSGKVQTSVFAHGSGASYNAWLFQPTVWQYGGEYSDENLNIKINEGGAVAAGQMWLDSVNNGWATAPQDNQVDFENGLTATTLASTGGLTAVIQASKFEVKTAFLPEGPAGFGCCTGGSGLGIIAKAPKERQEAAFQLANYFASVDGTSWWSQNTGYMPVRLSATEKMADFFAKNPNFKVAVDQLPKTKPQDFARTRIPNGDQIIGKGLDQILVQRQEVQGVFDDVKDTLTDAAQDVLDAIAALPKPSSTPAS